MSDDRLIELRVENRRLKDEVENLENKILSLVGNVKIEISGGPDSKNAINEDIISLISKTEDRLSILSSKIDRFYVNELSNLADKGIEIRIVTSERSNIPSEYHQFYDELKNNRQINVVNNPKVTSLLIFNNNEAIFTSGSLDRRELEDAYLLETKIRQPSILEKITEFYNLFLPSFMR